MLPALFSTLHLLALGIGLGAVWSRGLALRRHDVDAVLRADNWWGLAALLWLGTGLPRAFGTLEKGSAYYLASTAFQLKMALFISVMLIELWPMLTFIRWRIAISRGQAPDLTHIDTFARLNAVEVLGTLLIPFFASLTARGW
jgi:putative membrane protein